MSGIVILVFLFRQTVKFLTFPTSGQVLGVCLGLLATNSPSGNLYIAAVLVWYGLSRGLESVVRIHLGVWMISTLPEVPMRKQSKVCSRAEPLVQSDQEIKSSKDSCTKKT